MRGGCLGIFVVAALLSGCASGPTGNVALTDNVKPGGSRLIIYRSSSLGFAVMPNYALDGRVIGGSQAAGFLSCDLPPGRHEVAVNNLPLSTNLFGQGSEKVSLDLRAGSTTYLCRLAADGNHNARCDHADPGHGKPGPLRRRRPASERRIMWRGVIRKSLDHGRNFWEESA